jgi:hypothetical protein
VARRVPDVVAVTALADADEAIKVESEYITRAHPKRSWVGEYDT